MSKFLKILFLMIVSICVNNKVLASDNVLQAIQVNGVKDSYNIILKSDDVAELKKTVQAPNKMVLHLKGIRASKTINTIYNNTSSVDSVVVEPINDDTVKILIQGANVANAEVNFDTLKTPLGVLGNSEKQTKTKAGDELVLSNPMSTYKPVYNDSQDEEDARFSFAAFLTKCFKSKKIGGLMTFVGISLLIFSGLKTVKGKDNEIKVGLTQSLNQNSIQQREIDLYRGGLNLGGRYNGVNAEISSEVPNISPSNVGLSPNITSANYGVRAYQQGTKSPYLTSEMQRSRPATTAAKPSLTSQQVANMALKSAMQSTIQKTAPAATAIRQKNSNIDSMKFLESMTKIYEKNGRSDLAQGLKTNMKKAKMNLA